MKSVIKVNDLEVQYNGIKIINKVNFDVKEGEVFGMIGTNGAGKTTLIECIEGLRNNYTGNISVLGMNPKTDRREIYERIGIQLQETTYYDKVKVWEICRLFSKLYKNTISYEQLLNDFDLYEKRNTYISKLSGGQKQKLSIILSLIPNPDIVFLDELTTGVDPQARRSIWNLIKKMKSRGVTIYLITHFMDEAEFLCDRIAVMKKGEIKDIDTVNNLINTYSNGNKVNFTLNDLKDISAIKKINGVENIDIREKEITIYGDDVKLCEYILKYLNDNNIRYSNLSSNKSNLEDVFLKINGYDLKG